MAEQDDATDIVLGQQVLESYRALVARAAAQTPADERPARHAVGLPGKFTASAVQMLVPLEVESTGVTMQDAQQLRKDAGRLHRQLVGE